MAIKNDNGKGASGADDAESETGDETDETSDNGGADDDGKRVSRSTYMKTVSEAKKAREKARVLAEEKTALEEKLLAAEGNKDEQIKSLTAKLGEATKKQKDMYGAMARRTLSSQVKAAADKAGCIDSDAVMALADLSELEVDPESFEADGTAVSEMITALKKSKPYLFSKAGPKINGKMPGGAKNEPVEKEDLSKLSTAELKSRLRKLDLKK